MKSLLAVVVTFVGFHQFSNSAESASVVTDGEGIRYSLPTGWTARRLKSGLKLLPADAQSGEVYMAIKFDWGFTKADRTTVLGRFDRLVTSAGTYLKRRDDGWLKTKFGAMVVLEYGGRAPNGDVKLVRYYLASRGKYSIVVMAAGSPKRVRAYAKDIRSIFLSAVRGRQGSVRAVPPPPVRRAAKVAGNIDRQILGRWVQRKNTSSTSGVGYGASGTTYTFTFYANGTCSLNVATWIGVSAGGGNAFSGPGRGKTYRGRWSATGGKLVVKYADGSSLRNNYKVFQHYGKPVLKLYLPGGKPAYYRR